MSIDSIMAQPLFTVNFTNEKPEARVSLRVPVCSSSAILSLQPLGGGVRRCSQ